MSNIIQSPSNAKNSATTVNPAIPKAQQIHEFVGLPCQIVEITNMSAEEYDAMFPDDDHGEEFSDETRTFDDEEEVQSA